MKMSLNEADKYCLRFGLKKYLCDFQKINPETNGAYFSDVPSKIKGDLIRALSLNLTFSKKGK